LGQEILFGRPLMKRINATPLGKVLSLVFQY
jgi:hypothetical protein